MTRRYLPTALAVAAALLLALSDTLDPVHAVLLPAALLALRQAWAALDDGDHADWPPPPTEERHGARRDVSDLAWAAFTRNGRVSPRVTRRVRELAAHRLRARGIDPHDPDRYDDAAALLGADTLAGLLSPEPPTARTLHRWLDDLDRLTTDAPPSGRPTR
ncbi:hypothetical protein [Isoptericola sediminis]|uniref:DUF4129 domain-containing protein n=1 Tax=Isoptericola sediminis TaxID=2733572 RepID=A0A849K0S2_9MICO|nr:hypothetical protein [Isoptericola sediminis]NNU26271.1 hypothetical protein [Isoptericola sediminis]